MVMENVSERVVSRRATLRSTLVHSWLSPLDQTLSLCQITRLRQLQPQTNGSLTGVCQFRPINMLR